MRRYIRSGGKYKLLGTIALFPPMIGAFVAAHWTPAWSSWSYYLTVMPMTFGYSVFLCCQLGELNQSILRHSHSWPVALVSGVDSKAMVSSSY